MTGIFSNGGPDGSQKIQTEVEVIRAKTLISAGLIAAAGAFALCAPVLAQGDVTAETGYRRIKPPASYGTVLMERNTRGKDIKPVLFPHWAHRTKYTCNVCHKEMGTPMKAGESDIKQSDIEAGKQCGKCHNGAISFPASECDRCHSYGITVDKNAKIEEALKDLPRDDFGNMVNWAIAQTEGKIKPAAFLEKKGDLPSVDLDITMSANKFTPHPPDAVFPHKPHASLLDCSLCHEGIFKQKKGGNPEMNMMRIMAGQYCGVCHGRVAFPQEDCFRCHPKVVKAEEVKKEEVKKDEEKEKRRRKRKKEDAK